MPTALLRGGIPPPLCLSIAAASHTTGALSISFMALMAYERSKTIVEGPASISTKLVGTATVILVFLCCLYGCLPLMGVGVFGDHGHLRFECFMEARIDVYSFLTVAIIVVSFSYMIRAYWRIFRSVKEVRASLKASTAQSRADFNIEIAIARSFVLSALLFVVCWSPIIVLWMSEMWSFSAGKVAYFSTIAAHSHPLSNAILYATWNQNVKRVMLRTYNCFRSNRVSVMEEENPLSLQSNGQSHTVIHI
eukprot:TRINITY_DN13490_c0_g1_i4.p1 TRINITY_DN13490_c0_g1~~TRINITY_DN13490_c0_g1_i4.p1  ORF type:complete len:250 (+),score=-4.48 TRINITY_DN13490_c0_g1_i4:297-1046(+)